MHSMTSRSSLELMLDQIQRQEEDNEEGFVPALPVRPVSKARLPTGKRVRLIKFQENDLVNGFGEKEITTREAKQKCSYGENGDHLMQKDNTMDYTEKRDQLQGILEIQKYFRGHQARCYYHDLKTGILTLQSFVRAENARNKKNTTSRALQTQETAVILLQSVVRGWLSRRHLKCTKSMSKQSRETADTKDYIHIPYCEVVELQRRVLKTEAALQYKKDENSSLRLQLKQYEEKWQQSEAKMKSLEKTWQDQFTFIQVSLAKVAKKSNTSEKAKTHIRIMDYIPLQHEIDVDQTMPKKTKAPNGSLVKTGQLASDTNPRGELQKLRFRFEAWKKDYEIQLLEAKKIFQEINGESKMKKSGKKWWEI